MEAPCICPFPGLLLGIQLILSIIDVVSFMWLATAAYAEHLGLGNPVFIPYLNRAF